MLGVRDTTINRKEMAPPSWKFWSICLRLTTPYYFIQELYIVSTAFHNYGDTAVNKTS